LGAWVASQLPSLFTSLGVSNVPLLNQSIPDSVRYSFYVGAIGFLLCVLYTVFTTKETPPTEAEALAIKNSDVGIFDGIIASFKGIGEMPKEMTQLAACQFFSWLALFHMWIYMTPAVTTHLYGVAKDDTTSALYNEGANMVNLVGGWRTIVSVIVAFLLPYIASKLGRKVVHAICLTLGGLALISTRYMPDPSYLSLASIGLGFAWASILTMPYAMLTNVLPPKRMGYFVGVFNFFIVLPQIVAGFFSKFYLQLIDGDAMTAVTIGGISFLIAALLSLRVQDRE
jgi:maltose/moltooligosaccharide transporter